MRTVYAALLCAGSIFAQSAAEPARIADFVKLLEPQLREQRLSCTVQAVKPSLDYAFRFQSGYAFQVPMNQFGPGRAWTVLTEVTPQGGAPVYLLNSPSPARMRDELGATGTFLVGEGEYRVNWLLVDDLGRVCRTKWQIHADGNGKRLSMPPHTVSEVSVNLSVLRTTTPDPGAPIRLTLLLDAAPLGALTSRSRLSDADQTLLVNGLIGLLQRVPTSSVRLIVFSLQQQRELFREENFTLNKLGGVTAALSSVDFGAVQLGVLEKPRRYLDILTALLNDELRAPAMSDAVVFLGPQERYSGEVPKGAVDTPGERPRFFSIQFVPRPQWVALDSFDHRDAHTADDFDTVSKVVRSLKGKSVQVRTAVEFERAIEGIESSVRSER
jgi:hypothetical protein